MSNSNNIPKWEKVKATGDIVHVDFVIDKDIPRREKEDIIYQVMDEINDRMMYITELKLNNEVLYKNPFIK